MVKKVQAQMSTEVALDMLKASESIKSITTRVNSFTQSWKASEAQMKSAGDYVGAATAKYEGLGKSISAQQDKIAKLKKEQSELKGNTQETAQEYLKYQNQIDKATNKLSSLEAQQNRAKQSMEYQKSGLAGLQHSLELNNKAIQSHVERLQAEGKSEEAQVTKIKGLDKALENLTSQYKKQRTETIAAARDFGTSSDEYLKAKTRLNETATAMAKTKTETNELRASMEKQPHSYFASMRDKVLRLGNAEEIATKQSSRLSDVIKGSFVGGLAVSGIQAITSKIHEAIQAGGEFNKEQDTMKTVWHSLTTEAPKDGQQLIRYINKLGQSTIYSTDTINKMAQSFYHVHSNVKETKDWTNSFVALGSTLHMTNDAMAESGEQFAKIVAGGKASQEDLNVMINRFPMFGEAIQKATGKSMKQLQQMSSQGKLSAKQFEQALDYLGKKYKSGTAEAMTSYQGMSMYLSSRSSKLFGDIEKSSFNMSKSVKTDLLQLTSDKSMEKYAQGISAGIATIVSGATKALDYIAKHKEDLMGVTKSVASIAKLLFQGAWGAISGIINSIGIAFGSLGSQSKKSHDPIKTLNNLLSGLAKHKNAIKGVGGALIAAFATSKLMSGVVGMATGISKLTIAIKGVTNAEKAAAISQKALNIAMKANIFIAIAAAVISIGVALVELYKHNKKFRNFVNGIAKDAKKYIGKAVDAVKNLGKWAGNIGKGAKKGWNNFTKSTSNGAKSAVKHFSNFKRDAGKHLSNLWKSGKSTFSNGWKTVTNASKSGAHNVGNWFSNMANDTRKKAIQMFNSHKATFRSGYNVLNNYTQTWHDVMTGKWGKVGSDLKNTANSISKFVRNIFSDLYNWLNKLTGGQLGRMVDWWKSKMGSIGDIVASAKASVHKHFVDLVRGVISPFNTLLSGIHKGISWILDKLGSGKLSGKWKIDMPSYANGTKDTHQGGLAQVNDGAGSNYREIYRLPNGQMGMFPAVHNMILPLPKGTSILNGDLSAKYAKLLGIPMYKSGVGDFFSGLWNGAKDVIEDTDKIIKAPEEFMKSVLKHFIGNTSSKISLAQDLITGLPNLVAKNAVKWIKKMFESMANPSGSGVERWRSVIKAVAGQMNFNISEGQVAKLLRQINTESGGNPTVKQGISDINSREGHPAQGLLQFIPSTFKTWALKGHTNILNGADQIMAAINALNHGGEGGWKNIGNGHGWENGGIVRNWQYAQIAEHNKPEAVLPLESAKDSRAWQVLKAVVDAKTGGKSLDSNNTGSTSSADNKIAELTNTVNQMATMMKTIIGLNADQIAATKGIGTFDQKENYKQQARDLSTQQWTAL